MKKLFFFILFLKIIACISLIGQTWKQYPYQPETSILRFPDDEGFHLQDSIEWWYINGHVRGSVTGHEYSFMVAYFYEPFLTFDGFRILSLCDETAGIFHTQTLPCNYPVLDTNKLNLYISVLGMQSESFTNDTFFDGSIRPFDYLLQATSDSAALDIHCSSQKPPLIIADSGLINQGSSGYSYYYSLTNLQVSGTLEFEGISEEITGKAWIDRQYGNFNPYEKENYEWLNIQLDNNIEMNIWNIFTAQNTIPATPAYRICSISFDNDSTFTTSVFSLDRLKYSYTPDGERCYASQWLIKLDTMNIELLATSKFSDHEIALPFRFFEGSTSITGYVNGIPTTGNGFAELLHTYQKPEIQVINPLKEEILNPTESIQWLVINPDDGNKLQYDIEISYNNELSFNLISKAHKSSSIYWYPSYFVSDTSVLFRNTGYSADSTLSTQLTQRINILPMKWEYRACTGEEISFSVMLHNSGLLFQWLKDGLPIPDKTDSILILSNLQPSSSGSYQCIIEGLPCTDTTLAFSLTVEDVYKLHEYITLCEGDSFMSQPITASGPLILYDTLHAITGCDSIIAYHISLKLCTPIDKPDENMSMPFFYDRIHEKISMRFADSFTGKLMIFNLKGECIRNEQIFAKIKHDFSVQNMKPGFYIIHLYGTYNSAFKTFISP